MTEKATVSNKLDRKIANAKEIACFIQKEFEAGHADCEQADSESLEHTAANS